MSATTAPECTARTCDRCRRRRVDVLPRAVSNLLGYRLRWWCAACVRAYLNIEPICVIETLDVEDVA